MHTQAGAHTPLQASRCTIAAINTDLERRDGKVKQVHCGGNTLKQCSESIPHRAAALTGLRQPSVLQAEASRGLRVSVQAGRRIDGARISSVTRGWLAGWAHSLLFDR